MAIRKPEKKTDKLTQDDYDSCAWIQVQFPNGTKEYWIYGCTAHAVGVTRTAVHWKNIRIVGMHPDVRAGRDG